MCQFNYGKLKGRIIEKYQTQDNFCNQYGIAKSTLSLKLNNQTDFKQSEIIGFCKALDIDKKEINSYFFSLKSL